MTSKADKPKSKQKAPPKSSPTECKVVRQVQVTVDRNKHFRNWDPKKNLRKLKYQTHRIIRVD